MEKIDSELLTILRSLVMTGSQTKTALSLSKSQSTISRTLSRARTLFHDPLFVHNGSMLVPTNRMLEIYGHLPKLLGEMEALFAKEIFHPESLNLHLRVAAIDYAAQYIILPAFHAMKRIAPRISIELQQLNADTFRRLSLGLVDMAMRLDARHPMNFTLLSFTKPSCWLWCEKDIPPLTFFDTKAVFISMTCCNGNSYKSIVHLRVWNGLRRFTRVH